MSEIKLKYQEKLKSKTPFGYHLKYELTEQSIFGEIVDLLRFQAEKLFPASDREKVCLIHYTPLTLSLTPLTL
jgi:hypothetical protein